MKIILLNGPPRCGKDYAGLALVHEFGGRVFKMAAEVKERTHALYRLTTPSGRPLPAHAFEYVKDMRLQQFEGITPREAYIAFSEAMIKPLHGEKQFGWWLAEALREWDGPRAYVTDSGFKPEAEALIEEFGEESLILVRIHREGCDFSNDSRGYINLPGVQCHDITNTGDFRTSLVRLLQSSLA